MAASTIGAAWRGFLFLRFRSPWAQGQALGLNGGCVRTFRVVPPLSSSEGRDLSHPNGPYLAKYGVKIEELRRTDPETFAKRISLLNEQARAAVDNKDVNKLKKDKTSPNALHGRKSLASIMKLELIQGKDPEEIAEIWTQYFCSRPSISGVVPGNTFSKMLGRASQCPLFVYVLPRSDGYEFFVGQWNDLQVHFTSLINVQRMGENAPAQLSLQHFDELQKEKGIVLMAADVNPHSMTLLEARCLANQVQMFYGEDDYSREADDANQATSNSGLFSLVQQFTFNPSTFQHQSVIAALQERGLSFGLDGSFSQTVSGTVPD
uniref:ATP synthase mitochondrial F1 complex assembly factor 1 n=1 Tax=Eptatretus burgeri TaxID=7764 RepID=A0A8C4QMQ0_EPTBU